MTEVKVRGFLTREELEGIGRVRARAAMPVAVLMPSWWTRDQVRASSKVVGRHSAVAAYYKPKLLAATTKPAHQAVLKAMTVDAFIAGSLAAVAALPHRIRPVDLGQPVNWKPGWAETSGIRASGDVPDSLQDQLDGTENGNNPDTDAAADQQATTQSAYAAEAGAQESYDISGVSQYNVIPDGTACEVCQGEADGSPYSTDDDDDQPPFHNGCECETEPVDDGQEMPDEDVAPVEATDEVQPVTGADAKVIGDSVNVSPDEMEQIQKYQSSSKGLNGALRKQADDPTAKMGAAGKKQDKALQSIMNKNGLPHDTSLYRGIPPHVDPVSAASHDPAYLSTADRPGHALAFAHGPMGPGGVQETGTLIRYDMPAGSRFAPSVGITPGNGPNVIDGGEVILDKGLSFVSAGTDTVEVNGEQVDVVVMKPAP